MRAGELTCCIPRLYVLSCVLAAGCYQNPGTLSAVCSTVHIAQQSPGSVPQSVHARWLGGFHLQYRNTVIAVEAASYRETARSGLTKHASGRMSAS